MRVTTAKILYELLERFPELKTIECNLNNAIEHLILLYKNGGKLLICGNGGSAADALHIVGELMKDFICSRPLPEADKNAILKGTLLSTYSVGSISSCPQEDVYYDTNDFFFADRGIKFKEKVNRL